MFRMNTNCNIALCERDVSVAKQEDAKVRSKLHHLICTVGVEKVETIPVRVISDSELEHVEKRSK